MAYNQEYTSWHEHYWPDRQYFARMSDAFDFPTFFNEPGRWALAASSTAVYFAEKYNWSIFRLGSDVPNSRFYLVEKTNKYRSKASEIYKQELFYYIHNNINLISRI